MNQAIDYLRTRVGIEVTIQHDRQISEDKLPFHLKRGNEILPVLLEGREVVFVKPRHGDHPTPDQLKKQLEQVEKALHMPGVLVFTKIDTYARKRMIQNRTAFIVENQQTYMPFMLIDLDERKSIQEEKTSLSPSSQCLIIYHLMVDSLDGFNLKAIAELLRYSQMTITRSVKELEQFGLCEVSRTKDKRVMLGGDRKALWMIAKTLMKSPVRKKIWIDNEPNSRHLMLSGISALSRYTNISEDRNGTYAINMGIYKKLKRDDDLIGENKKYGNISLEIWKYDPEMLSRTKMVDPISLYLSLADDEDERVQQSLDLMIDELW